MDTFGSETLGQTTRSLSYLRYNYSYKLMLSIIIVLLESNAGSFLNKANKTNYVAMFLYQMNNTQFCIIETYIITATKVFFFFDNLSLKTSFQIFILIYFSEGFRYLQLCL